MSNKTISHVSKGEGLDAGVTLPVFQLDRTSIDNGDETGTLLASNQPLFKIKGELGKGGEGVVFSAIQSSLKRDIALKKHLPNEDSGDSKGRFISEAITTAIVDHPNVVPIYDLGEEEDGQVLMAMKQVKGTTWADLLHPKTDEANLATGSLSLDQHIEILLSVCNAISYAHSKSIAHCDLKPENVMVGQFGEVLVMDWGIAVDYSAEPDSKSSVRAREEIDTAVGTPFYLPPELALGKGRDIGPWTDIYLLGGILYEIFNGKPPHQGESVEGLLAFAVNQMPVTSGRDVPAMVESIYLKALQKGMDSRYQSVEEFKQALQGYLSHRESLTISDAAQSLLNQSVATLEGEEPDNESRTNILYDQFADAVAGFKQSLLLWAESIPATKGLHEARIAYANFALDNGDIGIAQSQAAELDEERLETWELRKDIEREVEALDRSNRLNKMFRWGLVLAGLAIVAGLFAIIYIINQDQKRSALRYANVLADSLGTFRAEYSKKVVQPLKGMGVTITHEPSKQGEIPFPATFSIDLANTISASQPDSEVRLYSDFPFPWRSRGGARTAFERSALTALRDKPDTPFYQFNSIGDKTVLQYAQAVKMKASCIGCHNTLPQSPKTDWAVGDVRGVQTVNIPIESSFSRLGSLSRELFGGEPSG